MARSTVGVPGVDSPDSGFESGDQSATDLGEPALIKASAIDIARGTVLAGRYQIEAVLGRGGSGVVLRAFDRVAQLPVAVKILKPELAADPRWIERFSRELRLARQIQHPNVCRVFDIAQADGHWFITMELATGGTLRNQLGTKAAERPLEDRVADIRAIVAGLAAIHGAGIVHRDVKPDNFLRMEDGRLVLSDFGLATNPSDASNVSILVGTPSYMPPEVALGEQASPRSDVWSLGVVLYETLFRTRPTWTTTASRRYINLPIDRKLVPMERALGAVLEDCLQDDVRARPADGREAQRQCEAALSARRQRPWKPRRGRSAWVWPAVVAACAVVGAVTTKHWWASAAATFQEQQSVVRPSPLDGAAADWTELAPVVASFNEPIHCVSWLDADRVLRLVVGAPRRALDLDVRTKQARPDPLPSDTFALGCPQRSNRGALLYEAFDGDGRQQIMFAPSEADTGHAKTLVSGSAPVWLPSGNEFIYTADDSHAAVFSLSVMASSIVSEAPGHSGMLVEKAVAGDGKSVALRYYDASARRHVVVHSLPSLAVQHAFVFDDEALAFAFHSGTDKLIFSVNDAKGRVLAEFDPVAGVSRRLGAVPGRDLDMPTLGIDQLALTSTSISSDVWEHRGGRQLSRLTNDGRAYYPDVSERGDLIVEHCGYDERMSIQLYEKGRPPRIVSTGPRDLTPRFLPGGNGWLYVDGLRRTIRRCRYSGDCEDLVQTGSDVPFLPAASEDMAQIAYVTAAGRQRLKVWSTNGTIRDLGPARLGCPPYWAPGNRIWVLRGTEQMPLWAAINASTGEQVETLNVEGPIRNEGHDCPILSAPAGVNRPPRVGVWTSEAADVRLLPAQHLAPGQIP